MATKKIVTSVKRVSAPPDTDGSYAVVKTFSDGSVVSSVYSKGGKLVDQFDGDLTAAIPPRPAVEEPHDPAA